MKILVTGSAGFIGSNLGHRLQDQGHDVVFYDNLSFGHFDNLRAGDNFVQDDIRNASSIEREIKNVDLIFHLAAIAPLPVCQSDPVEAWDVNVTGTIVILEAARKFKKKVIFASTSAIYENLKTAPFYEDDNTEPTLFYSLTKKNCEQIISSYRHLYHMDIGVVRLFNIYGEGQDMTRKSPPLMGYIIKQLLKNEAPILHGTGKQERDYVHIDDACHLMMKMMYVPGDVYNCCSGETASVITIFDQIKKEMDKNIDAIWHDPTRLWDRYDELKIGYELDLSAVEKETNKFSLGSYEKAEKELEWKPQISIEEGIKRVVDYCLKN
jgi:UDP-glucose 4-epimerase